MYIDLAGKKQGKYNVASVMTKAWVESEYYLNLESEDKKQYKEK